MVEKGEILKKRRRYCAAGAPNDVSYKNNKHMPAISIQYFQKDVGVWPYERVSIVDFEEILLFNVVGLMLRTSFEDACYENIALAKSGEGNRRIQLKRMLIKWPVPTPNTNVPHSFQLTFRKRRMVRFSLLFISRAWDVLVLHVFLCDYICAFLIQWKSYQLITVCIICSEVQALSWPISCRANSAKPLADTGINTSSKGPCIILT